MFLWSKTLSEDLDVLIREHYTNAKAQSISVTYLLLIGGYSNNDPFAVALSRIPFPDTNGDEKQKDSGKKSKVAAIDVDPEWICGFVQQVIRCLPGGLDVIGLASIGDKRAQLNAQPMLFKALKAINKCCSYANRLGGPVTLRNMYVVHVEAVVGVPVAYEVQFHESVPRSSVVKMSNQSLSLVNINSSVSLDLPLAVPTASFDIDDDFMTQFVCAIKPYRDIVLNYEGPVLLNNKLKKQTDLLFGGQASKQSKKGGVALDVDIQADLFLPPYARKVDENTVSDVDVSTVFVVRGGMQLRGLVLVTKWTTVQDVATALKQDLLRSLHSRCELHTDGMKIVEGEEEDLQALHQFPRRVTVEHPKLNAVVLSDYLFEGDSTEDCMETFGELLQLDIGSDEICDSVEQVPTVQQLSALGLGIPTLVPENEHVSKQTSISNVEIRNKSSMPKTSLFYLMIAVLVALVAVLVFALFPNQ